MILASIFRDSAEYLDRYQNQIKALREIMPVQVIAVEGDSSDDTWERLQATDYTVLKCEHGGPKFESVDHPTRWRQIAAACNVAMIAAARLAEADEPFCYIESDLIWDVEVLRTLVDDLERVPAVAPMSMLGGRFYDIWGFRRHHKRFSPYPPYCDDWDPDTLIPIDSAGSCFVTLGQNLRFVNFSPVDCILGVGRSLKENEVQLYLDPTVAVHHP